MGTTPRSPSRATVARLALLGAGGILLTSTLSGCGQFEEIVSPQSWAITYRVDVEGAGSDRLTDVSYGDTSWKVAFGADPQTTNVAAVETSAVTDGVDGREWATEAVIAAEHSAWVEATPGPEATARCLILIDGEREIHSVQGQRGETVTCQIDTPEFTT